jgi:hypothetical protein
MQTEFFIRIAHGVLLLLDLKNGSILEGPLDDVSIARGAFDCLALGKSSPKVGEVLKLDHVPDIGEARFDDS